MIVATGRTANTFFSSTRDRTPCTLREAWDWSSSSATIFSFLPKTPPLALTMSKYAWTPLNASSYGASGRVRLADDAADLDLGRGDAGPIAAVGRRRRDGETRHQYRNRYDRRRHPGTHSHG